MKIKSNKMEEQKVPEGIVTLDDLVERDEKQNVQRWILWKCEESIRVKKIQRGWDGVSVEGEAVLAFINAGRWVARCKVCANVNYVSWKTKILYCCECGNGGGEAAYPVQFPEDREAIEAELLKREVVLTRYARNKVEAALNSQAVVAGLGRNWRQGISVEDLVREVEDKKNVRGER